MQKPFEGATGGVTATHELGLNSPGADKPYPAKPEGVSSLSSFISLSLSLSDLLQTYKRETR